MRPSDIVRARRCTRHAPVVHRRVCEKDRTPPGRGNQVATAGLDGCFLQPRHKKTTIDSHPRRLQGSLRTVGNYARERASVRRAASPRRLLPSCG